MKLKEYPDNIIRNSRVDSTVTMNDGGLLDSLDEIKAEIIRQKHLHDKLIKEQAHISRINDDREQMAEEFRDRTLKTTKTLEQYKGKHMAAMDSKKKEVDSLHCEEAELQDESDMVERALKEQEAKHAEVEKAANVVALLPQREVVFKGLLEHSGVTQHSFDMKTHISYPMEGGTALITFENDIVAQKVRSLQSHKVTLEKECYIMVEAHPVQLLVPTSVELDTRVCPHSILVSQLPSLDSEIILDKLELHFSKSVNGGGEVASRDFLEDAGNAVLVFKDDHFVTDLAEKQLHEVKFQGKKKHKVRVTPFVNGAISRLETKSLGCARTVLLTGIPPVMDADNLQDMLEIYFQKASNGGGEITNMLYNPLGQTAMALFERDL